MKKNTNTKESVKHLFNDGKSPEEILRILECSLFTVRQYLRQLEKDGELTREIPRNNRRLSQKDVEKLKLLLEQHTCYISEYQEMAERLGYKLPASTLSDYLDRWGISRKQRGRPSRLKPYLSVLRKIWEQDPDAPLSKIAAEFTRQTGEPITSYSVTRALNLPKRRPGRKPKNPVKSCKSEK